MTQTRAWEQVLTHVEALLLDGTLVVGGRLPGERTLAIDLGVGRSSVREAIRVLEAMGLVRTATGSGPSAGAIIVATPDGAMSALMRLQVAAHGFPVADIVKTRLLLEGGVVRELAETGADIAKARLLLAAMDDETLVPEEFLALDAAFHLALAEAAGNAVVTATMAGLRVGIESYAVAGLATLADWGSVVQDLRHQHHNIVALIDAQDSQAAHDAVTQHIAGYYAAISLTEGTH